MKNQTKSPWRIVKGEWILIRANAEVNEEDESNANLIASEPLEELKRLVAFYDHVRPKISLKDGYPDPSAYIENLDKYISSIKVIIAKAEGKMNRGEHE